MLRCLFYVVRHGLDRSGRGPFAPTISVAALVHVLALVFAGCVPNTTPDVPSIGCNGVGRSRCVAEVSIGTHSACARLADQSVWCWGRNDQGQLGYASSTLCPEPLMDGQIRQVACHLYPLQVLAIERVGAIAVGGSHSCALGISGQIHCWGSNKFGQLGNNTQLASAIPGPVSAIAQASSVVAGARHSCAIVAGSAYCWGDNSDGQLGASSTADMCSVEGRTAPCSRVPASAVALAHVVELAAGDSHTCARTQTGAVFCWGSNVDAQLGRGNAGVMTSPTPAPVLLGAMPLGGIERIVAGADHTCALRDDGVLFCWGRHDRGQLGVSPRLMFAQCQHACLPTAVAVLGFEDEIPDDSGTNETFDASAADGALTDAFSVDASQRDAGDGRDALSERPEAGDASVINDIAYQDSASASLPVARPRVRSVAAGGAFTCAALSDETVKCWGSNRQRELGSGMIDEGDWMPSIVIAAPGAASSNPLRSVRALSAGGATSCATLSDQSLRCWGSNDYGALGVGSVTEQAGPTRVTW